MKPRFYKTRELEVINSLKTSIAHNNRAIDYLVNQRKRVLDAYNYNKEDSSLKKEVETLGYIIFTLEYVGKQYDEQYKKYGGK